MSENFESTDTLNQPRPPSGARPLYRSRTDRKVAGVCGGVAAYFGIDPIILRILVVVLSLFGGSGLLLYAAGWLLLPDEGQPLSEIQKLLARDGRRSPASVVVATLVVIACVIAVGSVFGGHWWLGSGPDVWPLLVVGGVGLAIWYSRRSPGPGVPPYVPTTPPYVPPGSPYVPPAAPYVPPAASYTMPQYTQAYTAPVPPAASYTMPQYTPNRRRKSVLGALTLSTAVIAAGVMLPFSTSGHWHVPAVAFLAVLLAVVGAGLVVGAFVGRSRGLIVWGILLSLVTALAAVIPAVDAHGTGDVTWRPTSAGALPADGYRWAAGDTRLDLTALPLTPAPGEIRGDLGAGTMIVDVPAGVRVVVDAHVGLGTIRLPDGRHLDGVGRTFVETLDPDSGPAVGTIRLRLDLGAGTLEVRRAQA
jgi:phage shock protein PspC (stress-responsive transcriptional regulator)